MMDILLPTSGLKIEQTKTPHHLPPLNFSIDLPTQIMPARHKEQPSSMAGALPQPTQLLLLI